MVKYISKGWNKFSVRFSEYEPLELALKFKKQSRMGLGGLLYLFTN